MSTRPVEAEINALEDEVAQLRVARSTAEVARSAAEAELARAEAELARIDVQLVRARVSLKQAYQTYTAIMEPAAPGATAPSSAPAPTQSPVSPPINSAASPAVEQGAVSRSIFFGRSLAESAAMVIHMAGRALTAEEIVEGMLARGFSFVSRKPVENMQLTLRKYPELLERIDKFWRVVDEERVARLLSSASEPATASDSMRADGRTQKADDAPGDEKNNDRSRMTLKGLANARARGVTGGRRPVLSPEKEKLFREMVAQGQSTLAIAGALNISKSTVLNYRKRLNTGEASENGKGSGLNLH